MCFFLSWSLDKSVPIIYRLIVLGFFYFGRLLRLLVIARAAPCFDWLCFSVFFGADRVEALPSVIFFRHVAYQVWRQ